MADPGKRPRSELPESDRFGASKRSKSVVSNNRGAETESILATKREAAPATFWEGSSPSTTKTAKPGTSTPSWAAITGEIGAHDLIGNEASESDDGGEFVLEEQEEDELLDSGGEDDYSNCLDAKKTETEHKASDTLEEHKRGDGDYAKTFVTLPTTEPTVGKRYSRRRTKKVDYKALAEKLAAKGELAPDDNTDSEEEAQRGRKNKHSSEGRTCSSTLSSFSGSSCATTVNERGSPQQTNAKEQWGRGDDHFNFTVGAQTKESMEFEKHDIISEDDEEDGDFEFKEDEEEDDCDEELDEEEHTTVEDSDSGTHPTLEEDHMMTPPPLNPTQEELECVLLRNPEAAQWYTKALLSRLSIPSLLAIVERKGINAKRMLVECLVSPSLDDRNVRHKIAKARAESGLTASRDEISLTVRQQGADVETSGKVVAGALGEKETEEKQALTHTKLKAEKETKKDKETKERDQSGKEIEAKVLRGEDTTNRKEQKKEEEEEEEQVWPMINIGNLAVFHESHLEVEELSLVDGVRTRAVNLNWIPLPTAFEFKVAAETSNWGDDSERVNWEEGEGRKIPVSPVIAGETSEKFVNVVESIVWEGRNDDKGREETGHGKGREGEGDSPCSSVLESSKRSVVLLPLIQPKETRFKLLFMLLRWLKRTEQTVRTFRVGLMCQDSALFTAMSLYGIVLPHVHTLDLYADEADRTLVLSKKAFYGGPDASLEHIPSVFPNLKRLHLRCNNRAMCLPQGLSSSLQSLVLDGCTALLVEPLAQLAHASPQLAQLEWIPPPSFNRGNSKDTIQRRSRHSGSSSKIKGNANSVFQVKGTVCSLQRPNNTRMVCTSRDQLLTWVDCLCALGNGEDG